MQFLLDTMCGGLVSYLRMCNYDTVYAGDRNLEADDDVIAAARADDRTIVTRDSELANRAADAILLTAHEVDEQLAQLHEAGVELELPPEPAVCGRCNGRLERVDPSESTPEYAPEPGAFESETPAAGRDDGSSRSSTGPTPVWRCQSCGQYFWRGSHWERVGETLPDC
ncbi:Mut7-C RNAse domain-containing protein [Natrialba aegyptia]|uniref:Mut7-C RNAse domain-containing protein n=1 Tax=Natrialba aegyptia DSM 13077 TaxID=1227491 RepID=M0B236_9EURY|nr:Mut7-C RNAse domain-containing protein [Natrialba aegyptia]ELZ03744.1 hypothetical protein C480_15305 [Natrialba aegyptia DSM 13077]